MANESTNKEKNTLSIVSLYYKRLLVFFDAVASFNQVRPIYVLLGEWMPPALANVYHTTFKSSPTAVKDAYAKRKADIEVDWEKVVESLHEMCVPTTKQDILEFRSLARGTNEEVQFRSKVRGRVQRLYNNVEKEVARRRSGETPKPIYAESLRDLITWYQTPHGKKK